MVAVEDYGTRALEGREQFSAVPHGTDGVEFDHDEQTLSKGPPGRTGAAWSAIALASSSAAVIVLLTSQAFVRSTTLPGNAAELVASPATVQHYLDDDLFAGSMSTWSPKHSVQKVINQVPNCSTRLKPPPSPKRQ